MPASERSRCTGTVMLRRMALVVVAALSLAATAPPVAWGVKFITVPGSSEKVGTGTTYRFKVKVQRSIRLDRGQFARNLEEVLFNDRS